MQSLDYLILSAAYIKLYIAVHLFIRQLLNFLNILLHCVLYCLRRCACAIDSLVLNSLTDKLHCIITYDLIDNYLINERQSAAVPLSQLDRMGMLKKQDLKL